MQRHKKVIKKRRGVQRVGGLVRKEWVLEGMKGPCMTGKGKRQSFPSPNPTSIVVPLESMSMLAEVGGYDLNIKGEKGKVIKGKGEGEGPGVKAKRQR